MDPIFDFILEGEQTDSGPHKGTFSGHEEEKEHNAPGSPPDCLPLDMCIAPDRSASPSDQNEIDEINHEYISSVANNGHPISIQVRDASVALIEEYLQDAMPLKAFLQKVSSLCIVVFIFLPFHL